MQVKRLVPWTPQGARVPRFIHLLATEDGTLYRIIQMRYPFALKVGCYYEISGVIGERRGPRGEIDIRTPSIDKKRNGFGGTLHKDEIRAELEWDFSRTTPEVYPQWLDRAAKALEGRGRVVSIKALCEITGLSRKRVADFLPGWKKGHTDGSPEQPIEMRSGNSISLDWSGLDTENE